MVVHLDRVVELAARKTQRAVECGQFGAELRQFGVVVGRRWQPGARFAEDVFGQAQAGDRAARPRAGASVLVGGMCETDFSGYPDCRDNTLKALQVAISLGLDTPMTVETPLMWFDKAQTWALADQLGGEPLIDLIAEHTHTCYLGDRSRRHEWGYGCGLCPACDLRRKGYLGWLGT